MVPTILVSLAAAFLAATTEASSSAGRAVPPRPVVQPHPHNAGRAIPASSPRTKQCFVTPGANGTADDAPAILKAFHNCNNGGTVVLDKNYTIATPLDLTFLQSVDLAITGQVNFKGDVDYWVGHSFRYAFQDATAFWRFGGKDVNIYGNGVGVINGNGQPWYDRFASNATLQRPVLFVTDGLSGGSITGLKMVNSPSWFNLIANSSDLLVSDLSISVHSTSKNPAKNTDGWDTYRSDSIVIQNSVIENGDDCVSFKPNSTNIVVQGLHCNGSHGISVGSLGQYVLQYDIVENVYVYNISMSNASDGARIKVWPGINSVLEPSLSGGGGNGYVKNITYEKFYNSNNDWAIEVTGCYGQSNKTLCSLYPSNMTISDVYFKDIWGTTSKKYDPKVGTLVCSSPGKCQNIQAHNVSVTPPSGKAPKWVCSNVDETLLEGFDCVAS